MVGYGSDTGNDSHSLYPSQSEIDQYETRLQRLLAPMAQLRMDPFETEMWIGYLQQVENAPRPKTRSEVEGSVCALERMVARAAIESTKRTRRTPSEPRLPAFAGQS